MHSMSNAWCCRILKDPAEQVIIRRPSRNTSSDLDIYSFKLLLLLYPLMLLLLLAFIMLGLAIESCMLKGINK